VLPAPVSVSVRGHAIAVVTEVTGITTVPAVGLVMVVTRALAMPLSVAFVISVVHAVASGVYVPPGALGLDPALAYVLSDTVAPYWKLEPSKVAVTVPAAASAEGLTFSRPLPTVKPPTDETVPPSVLVTVTVNVPGVAAAPPDGFVGVTLTTIAVEVIEVTVAVKAVPSTVLAKETVAPATKPEPAMVTVVAGVASQTELGLIELIVGAASMVIAPVTVVLAPFASVSVAEHVPAAPAAELKLAVPVVAEVSTTDENVIPAPVQPEATNVSLVAPLSAKPEPVKVAVPVT
jgi:hypothetical protein